MDKSKGQHVEGEGKHFATHLLIYLLTLFPSVYTPLYSAHTIKALPPRV